MPVTYKLIDTLDLMRMIGDCRDVDNLSRDYRNGHEDVREAIRAYLDAAPQSRQERPEPADVSGHGRGRQDGLAGLSLAVEGTE